MNIVKKLAFAPVFLIIFTLFVYRVTPLLASYDFFFSLSINTFLGLLILSFFISISCFLFVLFTTLASDWKMVLPVAFLSALIPMLFMEPALGLVFTVAIFISFLLTYLSLDSTLKSYLTFKPEALLGPSIRHLSGLLILAFCLVYFLSTSKIIAQAGFQIPDSLIETALKMTPLDLPAEQNSPTQKLPAISQEQPEPGLLYVPGQGQVLHYVPLERLVATDGLVYLAPDEHELAGRLYDGTSGGGGFLGRPAQGEDGQKDGRLNYLLPEGILVLVAKEAEHVGLFPHRQVKG